MTKSVPTVAILSSAVWAASATAQGPVMVHEIAWTNLGLESPLKRPPRWSGGSFLTYDTSNPGLVALVAYGRDGTPFPRVSFTIPGATVIRAYSAARSSAGIFAVSGSAFTPNGRGAMFLAWISADGAEQRVTRTNPFAIDNLVFGPDGAVWAVGREIENGFVPADYFVVRRSILPGSRKVTSRGASSRWRRSPGAGSR